MPQTLSLKVPGDPRDGGCDRVEEAIHPEQVAGSADVPVRKSIRRDPPPRPRIPDPTDNVLDLRIAEEIDYARGILETMGNDLANDPTVIVRHMAGLQSVDVIGQLLGHIANVVRSSDPPTAVELIGMADLKARLTRRSIG